MTEHGDASHDQIQDKLEGLDVQGRLRVGSPTGDAWDTFLRAHASLMRVLDAELAHGAGVSLSDFDVLIQLGLSEGARLRMSELARKALISRSGMTRRAGQLEERGLVERQPDPGDRRSVIITLTAEGNDVLRRALPVHIKGVNAHFLDRLSNEDLATLRSCLEKIVIDCDFG